MVGEPSRCSVGNGAMKPEDLIHIPGSHVVEGKDPGLKSSGRECRRGYGKRLPDITGQSQAAVWNEEVAHRS